MLLFLKNNHLPMVLLILKSPLIGLLPVIPDKFPNNPPALGASVSSFGFSVTSVIGVVVFWLVNKKPPWEANIDAGWDWNKPAGFSSDFWACNEDPKMLVVCWTGCTGWVSFWVLLKRPKPV